MSHLLIGVGLAIAVFLGHALVHDIRIRRDKRERTMTDDVAIFLATVRDKCADEQEKMRTNGFVIDNLDDRWQKLAFTFYSDIAEMSMRAKDLLEGENEKAGSL